MDLDALAGLRAAHQRAVALLRELDDGGPAGAPVREAIAALTAAWAETEAGPPAGQDAAPPEIPGERLLQAAVASVAALPVSETPLERVLTELACSTLIVLPQADGTSVTLLEPASLGATNERVRGADRLQYSRGDGPCLATLRTGQPHLTADVAADPRWAAVGPELFTTFGFRSVLALPLVLPAASGDPLAGGDVPGGDVPGGDVPGGEPHRPVAAQVSRHEPCTQPPPGPAEPEGIGVLNVYAEAPDAFDEVSIRIAQLFAEPAAVTLADARAYTEKSRLAEQLAEAMASRASIEQAKGILMVRYGIPPDEAFGRLVVASQHRNRKLREIAAELVAAYSGQRRDQRQVPPAAGEPVQRPDERPVP